MRLLTSFASVHRLRTLLVFLAVILCNSCKPSSRQATFDTPPSFWVWHRSTSLQESEIAALHRARSSRVYWQVVEFGWKDDRWEPRQIAPKSSLPPSAIPVIRLDPGTAILNRPEAAAKLTQWLRFWSGGAMPKQIQIDYDCPVNRLGDYAVFLQALKSEGKITSVSVTALASWIDAPAFPRIANACEELIPMFYDLEADRASDVIKGQSIAMVHPLCSAWIQKWNTCTTPWRAGLPNFERLTLFADNGTSLGHLRQWTPEQVRRHAALEELHPPSSGIAWYRVTADSFLAGTVLKRGQSLCWRAPDEEALRQAIHSAEVAGASGIVWFTLPGPGIRAHLSAEHLAALSNPSRQANLRMEYLPDGRMALINDGPRDLPCNLNRMPYRLHLTTQEGLAIVRSDPGDFLQIEGNPSSPLSSKIVLHFLSLPAGARLETPRGWHTASQHLPSPQWSVESPDNLSLR